VDEQLLNCQAIYGVIGTIRACPSADFSKYGTSLWLAKNCIGLNRYAVVTFYNC
jgi:hypothetical protein